MKRVIIIFALALLALPAARAQNVAIKTNVAAWAAYGTTNLGVEAALWPRITFNVDGFYNPWTFDNGKQSIFWAIQPELRLWFCRKFTGHFIGLHCGYADFDGGMQKYRYTGEMALGGLSYGYSLPLCKSWRLEANVGAGYRYASYDKTGSVHRPGDVVMYGHEASWTFGLTRGGLNIIYLIR